MNPFLNVPAPGGFDPIQLAFGSGQELYKSVLIGTINGRRMLAGRPPVAWPVVGGTASEVYFRERGAELRRYAAPGRPKTRGARSRHQPILMVCSLINRPYVLDLLEERSVVRRFLDEGFDVWLLDWGTPRPSDASLGLADYVLGLLPRAAEAVRAETGARAVHVLGYCMGGSFALMAAAAGALPAASILALATPVDMHDRGLLSAWCRAPGLDPREIASAYGNLPPWLMQPAFKMLDPVGVLSKFRHLEGKLLDDEFLRFFLAMETWLEDSVAFPGGAFADWVNVYRDNALVAGTLSLGGRRVDLQNLACPILNVVAEADYITPCDSSLALAGRSGAASYEEIRMPGGHIGLSTGGAAHRTLWPRAAEWMRACEAEADLRTRTKSPARAAAKKKSTRPAAKKTPAKQSPPKTTAAKKPSKGSAR